MSSHSWVQEAEAMVFGNEGSLLICLRGIHRVKEFFFMVVIIAVLVVVKMVN